MSLAQNKKALFEYEILEKLEAGLVLTGQEVKSVKLGQTSLAGSYVTFYSGQAYLLNMHITQYKPAGRLPDYEPTHSRRLLLHKKQIAYLQAKSQEKGLTIIPLHVYTKGRIIKVEIGIGRGKKLHDKRETIKKRDTQREMQRFAKN